MLQRYSKHKSSFHAAIESRDEYRPIVAHGLGTNYKINRRGDIYSTFIKYQEPVFVKHVLVPHKWDSVPNCQLHIGRKAQRKNQYCPVDRLVAEAFVPNPHHYQYLVHRDYCLKNVHADNLEWVSRGTWLRYERKRQHHAIEKNGGRLLDNSAYYVTADGEFHSIYRRDKDTVHKLHQKHGNSVILKNLQGVRKSHRADEMIARAFIPNPHNHRYIKHLNCDIYDDRVANLAWCSKNEMVLYNYFYGNQDVHGYQIINVDGYNTLYAINRQGTIYSLLQRRAVQGKNKKPNQSRLFNLKICGHSYSWSREKIREYATPVPDYQQSLI